MPKTAGIQGPHAVKSHQYRTGHVKDYTDDSEDNRTMKMTRMCLSILRLSVPVYSSLS